VIYTSLGNTRRNVVRTNQAENVFNFSYTITFIISVYGTAIIVLRRRQKHGNETNTVPCTNNSNYKHMKLTLCTYAAGSGVPMCLLGTAARGFRCCAGWTWDQKPRRSNLYRSRSDFVWDRFSFVNSRLHFPICTWSRTLREVFASRFFFNFSRAITHDLYETKNDIAVHIHTRYSYVRVCSEQVCSQLYTYNRAWGVWKQKKKNRKNLISGFSRFNVLVPARQTDGVYTYNVICTHVHPKGNHHRDGRFDFYR
jgi:hypothetical protein